LQIESQILNVSKLRKEFLVNYGSHHFLYIFIISKKEINNIKWLLLLITINSLLFNETRISLPVDPQVMHGELSESELPMMKILIHIYNNFITKLWHSITVTYLQILITLFLLFSSWCSEFKKKLTFAHLFSFLCCPDYVSLCSEFRVVMFVTISA
jgi:hypothetical protein